MFEEKTYEALLKKKLDAVNPEFDKREGAVIYDALAPNSAEQAQMYLTLDWVLKQMFGDSAEREYLVKIAEDTRGIRPKEATCAVLKAVFNTEVEIGERFSLNMLDYVVTALISAEEHSYQVRCETPGTAGNRQFGALIPVRYRNGLTSARLTELLIPGEEQEDTEVFRKRWRDAFRGMAFGGNKADYINKINGISGVGGCKCYRSADEMGVTTGGHVKCVVISSDFQVPGRELINSVQQKIDPFQNQEGDGLAPIGHIVHIMPVTGRQIDVTARITYDTGYSYPDVKSYLEGKIDSYFKELSEKWADEEKLVVRISRLESELLEIEGIIDIADTKLNGLEANVILDLDEIPVRGAVNG